MRRASVFLLALALVGCAHDGSVPPVVAPPPVTTPDPVPPVELPAPAPPAADPAPPAADPAPVPVEPPPAQPAPPPPPVADPAPVDPPPSPGRYPAVGVNLVANTYWSTEAPFIDRAKSAGWSIDGGAFHYADIPAELLGEGGWPTSQPEGTRYKLNVPLDTPVDGQAIPYVLTWTGSAAFEIPNVRIIESGPGRIVFASPTIVMIALATTAADPVRDLHIVRQDQEAAFLAGAIFNPVFIDVVASRFPVLRTMDWTCANNNLQVTWDQRPKPGDRSWGCVPWEIVFALANAAGADPYINVPVRADDAYVAALAQLAHDTLAPARRPYVELSNEIWNTTFDQNRYAAAQTVALWGSQGWDAQYWQGFRAAQVAVRFQTTFADRAAKPVNVLASRIWLANDVNDTIEAGVRRAGWRDVGALFDALAVAPYHGDNLSTWNWEYMPTVLGWADGGDAGVQAALDAIESGPGMSVNWYPQFYPIMADWAKARGLRFIAYEGGWHGTWHQIDDPSKLKLMGLVQRMAADPRIGRITLKALADFRAAGGDLYLYYNDVQPLGQFGPWGARPDLLTDTPRWQALSAANAHSDGPGN